MLPAFFDSVVDLITRTSTDLPPDVRAAMDLALKTEAPATRAGQAITIIAQNIDQASSCEGPICQDTGMPTFEVKVPVGANQIWMRQQIREAVAEATRRGKLRPNSVDSITGENSGNNLGPGTPIIHFDQWENADDRDQADPQGRRLREHERSIFAACGARSSGTRRSIPCGCPQVHPARRVEGAGEGMQPWRRRRLHRRRSHVWLHARQGATVSDARRSQSRSSGSRRLKTRSWRRRTS